MYILKFVRSLLTTLLLLYIQIARNAGGGEEAGEGGTSNADHNLIELYIFISSRLAFKSRRKLDMIRIKYLHQTIRRRLMKTPAQIHASVCA